MDNVLSVFSNCDCNYLRRFRFPDFSRYCKADSEKVLPEEYPSSTSQRTARSGCRKKIRRETQEIKKGSRSENNFRSGFFSLEGLY